LETVASTFFKKSRPAMGVPGFIALFAIEVEINLIDRLFALKRILAFIFVGFTPVSTKLGCAVVYGNLLGRCVVGVLRWYGVWCMVGEWWRSGAVCTKTVL